MIFVGLSLSYPEIKGNWISSPRHNEKISCIILQILPFHLEFRWRYNGWPLIHIIEMARGDKYKILKLAYINTISCFRALKIQNLCTREKGGGKKHKRLFCFLSQHKWWIFIISSIVDDLKTHIFICVCIFYVLRVTNSNFIRMLYSMNCLKDLFFYRYAGFFPY